MHRIAQIIPYFGKWPEWIDLYFYSCAKNPMIDFIFFTDCPRPEKEYGKNLLFHNIKFDEYKQMVSKRLNVDFSKAGYYKLTDLKPFLGYIHEDIFVDYDWWGFGDLDLVYGNLETLLTEDNLKNYNLITTHDYHIAGHFTVMRNNAYYREICFKIPDWRSRLSEEKHYGFDESSFSDILYPTIKWPLRFYKYVLRHIWPDGFHWFMRNANRLIHPFELFRECFTSPAPKSSQDWTYDACSGTVTDPGGRELPYLHFLFFKKTAWLDARKFWDPGFYKMGAIKGDETVIINLDSIKAL